MPEELIYSDSRKKMMQRALHLCAAAEQCEADLRDKLARWGTEPADADAIVARLKAGGYLDDLRYARLYCESKVLQQRWGRQKVAYALRGKGLTAEAIASAMAAIPAEAYAEVLRAVAAAKARTLRAADERTRRARLSAFLAQRGFTFDEINSVINDKNNLI